MKSNAFLVVAVFSSVLAAGSAQAASGGPGFGDRLMAPSAAVLETGPAQGSAVPAGGICPDIASTPKFRAFGLGYIHTLEFADSLEAVADGGSRYSPAKIPAGWKKAARAWREHLVSGKAVPVPEIPEVREDCAASLIFHASLDYRSRWGLRDLDLAYPYKVRAAVAQLEEIVAAKRAESDRLARRAREIASRVAMAEMLGAARCQPDDLARVKSGLEEAIRAAADLHVGIPETEEAFRRVEQASQTLLVERRYASRHGVPCLSQ